MNINCYDSIQHSSIKVGILNLGVGNCSSIVACMRRLGIDFTLVSDVNSLKKISHLIIPGVGEMSYFMNTMKNRCMYSEIKSFASYGYIFGICLGFQALFEFSHEGNSECLGLLDGQILPIQDIANNSTNIGYSSIYLNPSASFNKLRFDIIDMPYYFVHSYYNPPSPQTSHFSRCGNNNFTAFATNGENIFGTQFHPELSHSHGRKILHQFIKLS